MNKWEAFKKLYNVSGKDTTAADNYKYHFEEQFANIDFAGKSVLEIGCGRGFLSLYIALFTEAAKITALDESAGHGGKEGVLNVLRDNVSYLKLGKRLEIIEADAIKFDSADPFDIIIANNCLHHFVNNGQKYFRDPAVSEAYIKIFKHLWELLANNGQLVIGEIDPFNLWRFLLPNLFFSSIEWHIHPPLSGFLDAIEKAGFHSASVNTDVPYKLRILRRFVSNALFRPFMRGSVFIFAKKCKYAIHRTELG